MTTFLDGGPVLVADLPGVDATAPPSVTGDVGGNPATATITCAVQTSGTGLYSDPDAAAASASGRVAVVLPPTPVTYPGTPGASGVWICTTWTVTDNLGHGATYYVDSPSGDLLTDPDAARCTPLFPS